MPGRKGRGVLIPLPSQADFTSTNEIVVALHQFTHGRARSISEENYIASNFLNQQRPSVVGGVEKIQSLYEVVNPHYYSSLKFSQCFMESFAVVDANHIYGIGVGASHMVNHCFNGTF